MTEWKTISPATCKLFENRMERIGMQVILYRNPTVLLRGDGHENIWVMHIVMLRMYATSFEYSYSFFSGSLHFRQKRSSSAKILNIPQIDETWTNAHALWIFQMPVGVDDDFVDKINFCGPTCDKRHNNSPILIFTFPSILTLDRPRPNQTARRRAYCNDNCDCIL